MDWYFNAGENYFSELVNSVLTAWFQMFNTAALNLFSQSFVIEIMNAFKMLGCTLFSAGFIIALLEYLIEASDGKGEWHNLVFNTTKGVVFATCFVTIPLSFFNFTNEVNVMMSYSMSGGLYDTLASTNDGVIRTQTLMSTFFSGSAQSGNALIVIITMIIIIVFGFKIMLDNVSRAGSLFVLIIFGSLHAFSIPRGYIDSSVGWCKQVLGLCLTNVVENILMITGFYIWTTGTSLPTYLAGIGALCAATLVPRLAQQFSVDTSIKANISQAMFMSSMIMNTSTRLLGSPIKKIMKSAK